MGLGDNTIRVLVTDDDGPEPVVMATYTVHMHRENRPSLPMFGDHTMCSFLQVSPRPEAGPRLHPGPGPADPSAGAGPPQPGGACLGDDAFRFSGNQKATVTWSCGGMKGAGGVFVVVAGLFQKLLKSSSNKKIPVKFFCCTLLSTVASPSGMFHRGAGTV